MDEKSIFNTARKIANVHARDEYLRLACGDDHDAFARINDLLAEHVRDTDFLVSPPVDAATIPPDHVKSDKQRGSRIGPYKLLQEIGEGGMGSVWMAEQEKPIRRRVALKLIHGDSRSTEIITRFEAERQALAMMNHQNIAQVLDAGTTSEGTPYFVMELVKGIPLTEYCDQNKLSIRERMELFVPVCKAVQHAHQKGIIHRDLKPSNVLVTLYDGEPVPKVIDFGLAKALEHTTQLTDKTMFTEFGKVVGTLQYMSPEQAEMNALDVDTRSDVYSLGVMLYELLTGSTPLDKATLGKNALLQVLAIIREKDPPRPSARLSSSGDAVTSISEQRKIIPAKLQQILLGELDWVVMKALEKDRTRRYETANAFALDISRYLNHEMVVARPPSTGYKLRKFIRKNRGLVAAVASVVALLIVGITGTSIGTYRAEAARKIAEQQTENARQSEKQSAIALQLLTDSFKSTNPFETSTAQVTAKDVLVNALASLKDSKLDVLGKAKLLSTLSNSFLGIGEYNLALSTANDLFEINKAEFGADHPETLDSMNDLVQSYGAAGRTKEAVDLAEKTLDLSKSKLGKDHPVSLRSASNLAHWYLADGRIKDAVELSEETLKLATAKLEANHPITLLTMSRLAACYVAIGRNDEALNLFAKAYAVQKAKFGVDHPETLGSMNNLAICFDAVGRTKEALELREKTLALMKEKFAEDHPYILALMQNLAISYDEAGRFKEGLALREKALALSKTKLGEDHPDTLDAMNALVESYLRADRNEEALELGEKTFALMKSKLGDDHPFSLNSMNGLVESYLAVGKKEEALKLGEKAFDLMKSKLGDDHPFTLRSMNGMVESYLAVGRNDAALELGKKTFELMKATFGENSLRTLLSMYNLALSYEAAEKFEESLELWKKSFALQKAKCGPHHRDTLDSMANLARGYDLAGLPDEAINLWEKTLALRKANLGSDHPDTLGSMNGLVSSYITLDRNEEALELAEESFALTKSKLGDDHPVTLMSMQNLAFCYKVVDRLDDALELWEKTLDLMKSKLGEDDLESLLLMFNLALSYEEAERFEEALKLWQKSIDVQKAKLGADHTDTLISMNNLAGCYAIAGRFEEALKLVGETLAVRKAKLGADHTDTQESLTTLDFTLRESEKYSLEHLANFRFDDAEELLHAMKRHLGSRTEFVRDVARNLHLVYLAQRKYSEALNSIDEWLELLDANKESDRSAIAWAKTSQSICYLELDKLAEAETSAKQALAMEEITSADRHRCRSVLGVILAHQKKFDEAEKSITEGYNELEKMLENMPAHLHWYVPRAAERIVKVYDAADKPVDTKKWKNKLKEIESRIHELNASRMSLSEADKICKNVWNKVEKPQKDSSKVLTKEELKDMRRVCRQFPTGVNYNALGVAEYRMGNFEEAIAATKKSLVKLPKELKQPSADPVDLAVLAMSHHQLDNANEANEFRKQLEEAMKLDAFKNDEVAKSFLREVIELLDSQ